MAEFSAETRGARRSGYFSRYGEDAVYQKVTRDPNNHNPKTGNLGDTSVNTNLTKVCQGDVTLRQIKQSGGNLQAGDKWFRMTADQVPGGTPSKLDRIQFGGVTYQIIDWTYGADRQALDIAGRKV